MCIYLSIYLSIYPLLIYLPHRGEEEITGTYIYIYTYMSSCMSIYSFTPYMWIITTFVPIYTYI